MSTASASPRPAEMLSLGRFPRITGVVCAVQVFLFFFLAEGRRALPLDALIDGGAKLGANVLELGETWRMLTANLLHRDVLHLGFNTFFLFNVGGAVENALRARDYGLLLLFSGLATTFLGLAMSSVPSVGASGLVLGLFASASVLGYKYGERLPKRYRRYFGGAVVPFGLFILYVGFASPDTDNWGHIGGVLGGGVATFFFVPRFIEGAAASRTPLVLAGVLLFGLWAWGASIARLGPGLTRAERPEGLAFAYPTRWGEGVNHLGHAARGNRLGVSLGVEAERSETRVDLEALRAEFVAEHRALEASGALAKVEVGSARPFLVPGAKGLELDIRLESRAGPQRTRNLLVARGYYRYRVVLSAPTAWAGRYADVFDALVDGIHLTGTEGLREAREIAETFPGMASAQVELGRELAAVGDVGAASAAYRRALVGAGDRPDAVLGLARLALDFGGDLDAAERATSGLLSEAPSDELLGLVADLRRKLGRRREACELLLEALERGDRGDFLRRRLDGWRCGRRPS